MLGLLRKHIKPLPPLLMAFALSVQALVGQGLASPNDLVPTPYPEIAVRDVRIPPPEFVSTPGIYQDGRLLQKVPPDYKHDVKIISQLPSGLRFANYPDGYSVDVPAKTQFDIRFSPAYVRAYLPTLDIKISREYSPYADVPEYLRDYPNRFVARDDYAPYRDINGIEIMEDTWQTINGRRVKIVSYKRSPSYRSSETQNQYLIAYVLTGGHHFYTLMFRAESIQPQRTAIFGIIRSFKTMEKRGTAKFHLDLRPIPARWNPETQAVYDNLRHHDTFMWGIFYPWALTDAKQYDRIQSIEKRLGFNFPIILHYLYLGHDFPTEDMQRAYERGQMAELTMQVAWFNNDNQATRNANFDLLDGELDHAIRRFAQGAKAFGHPFLFRLNNEMNTDWSQYSGVLTLCDVDIFIKNWRRIFDIFDEEGVDNAIWVFNPNHHSYPPMNWNHQVAYYPGNEYVHVIGLTGYNTGDYYQEVTAERWQSFKEVYDPIVAEYRQLYSRFPWIITEFASSSVGGDKGKWIEEMFETLAGYPEIRAAVWWSYADYDWRPGKKSIAARRYWLDEKDEYLSIFREGLRKQGLIRPE